MSPSRKASDAADSAGSVNRISSVSWTAPWQVWTSRSAPPAPIAASCWVSPINRTDAPRSTAHAHTWARLNVSAIPASSITSRLSGPICWAHRGRSWWVMDQVSLARVSVVAPVCSRSWAAAAADGANPNTVPPEAVQAVAKACIAVVFPAPAGAIASCSRRPEVAMAVTSSTCPTFSSRPACALASSAAPTWIGAVVRPPIRPANSTNWCSAATTRAEVNRSAPATVYTEVPSARSSGPGSVMPRSGRASRIDRSAAVVTNRLTAASTRSNGMSVRRTIRSASARMWWSCQVAARASITSTIRSAAASNQAASARCRSGLPVAPRVRSSILISAPSEPKVSTACRCQTVRCSASERGSCLASRVSRVACWASFTDSTTDGGRP